MKKNNNIYFVTITSKSKGTLGIKYMFRKFDPSIRKIETFSVQKTTHTSNGNESIKYLHNLVVTTRPRADFPKVWYGLINHHKKILNLEIRLLSNDDNI